jgi:hypothetical protein
MSAMDIGETNVSYEQDTYTKPSLVPQRDAGGEFALTQANLVLIPCEMQVSFKAL